MLFYILNIIAALEILITVSENFTLVGNNFLANPVFFGGVFILGIPIHTCKFLGGEKEAILILGKEETTTKPPNNEPATLSECATPAEAISPLAANFKSSCLDKFKENILFKPTATADAVAALLPSPLPGGTPFFIPSVKFARR